MKDNKNYLANGLAAVIVAAEEANKAETGDYVGEDGLLYCHKCNTPKQTRVTVPFLGKHGEIMPCMCKCASERFKAEEERRKQAKYMEQLQALRRMVYHDDDLTECTFANDDGQNPRITAAMQRYTDNFQKFRDDGMGLLLYGSVGTGKTFHAACIANALTEKGIPALVTSFTKITNILSDNFGMKQEIIDNLNKFQLLVIDDLGAERKSEYMQETVYSIIDSRYRSGLPLIVTTNLSIEEIKKPAEITNARIYDRVLQMCHPIHVEGVSRRRQQVAKTYGQMNDLLGL